jgi:hypothetical protein
MIKSIKCIFILAIVLSNYTIVLAQNTQQEYLNGKSLFKSEKYNLAMETFKPIIQQNDSKQFAPYASFYYAVAAYRQKYPALARDMFLQLNERFPKWKNKSEVNFWLSRIYLEQGDFLKAQEYAIDKSLTTENSIQKRYHYLQIQNIDSLISLQEQMPNDADIAFALAKAISKQRLVDQDRNKLLGLIKDFDLNEDDFEIARINQSIKKDAYNVAVIMPFMTDQLAPNLRKKSNQFVYDMYNGIKLAVAALESSGVHINLYAYDTQKDVEVTQALLKKEELQTMNLIIGPLFPQPSYYVSDFSYRHKINMINPLSSNPEVIGNNPYSFLYQPQYTTQAIAAATYVRENIENKNSIIFYGGSMADSVKAFTYKAEIEKDSFNIIMMRKVPKDTSRYILQILTSKLKDIEEVEKDTLTEDELDQFFIAKDSVGSIYVASDHRLLASSAVSSVQIRGDSIAVIGSGKWLDYKFIDYSAYERLGITLVAPNHLIALDSSHQYINDYFINKYSTPASKHACYGYDLMMLTGKSLHKYGVYFQKSLYAQDFTSGTLTPGYSYQNANDNQYVPLLQFKNNIIKVINTPETSKHDKQN